MKYFECLIPAELVEQYADWQECAAFRIVPSPDSPQAAGDVEIAGTVVLEVTKDLELVTAPEGS